MRLWDEWALPRLTDRALDTPEIHALRREVCVGLHGRVVELGFGSGPNIRHYPQEVASVGAVEPSDGGWRLSVRRRTATPLPIERVGLDGAALEQESASVDAVLSTFTLCTIPRVERALTEVRRILVPGGRFHFLEHGLAPAPAVERWQRRLEPIQRRVAGGCHLTREITGLVQSAGFEVEHVRTEPLPGPRIAQPWGYVYLGVASRPR
jgi:ubiquinone/menaquinone biosynthesis C-methylase UbiE